MSIQSPAFIAARTDHLNGLQVIVRIFKAFSCSFKVDTYHVRAEFVVRLRLRLRLVPLLDKLSERTGSYCSVNLQKGIRGLRLPRRFYKAPRMQREGAQY